jgi:hypothetical protein
LGKITNGRQPGKKQIDNETTLEKQLMGDNPLNKDKEKPWIKTMDMEATL